MATTQTLTGLINGVQYRFRVQAVNALGVSAFSTVTNPVVTGSRLPGVFTGDTSSEFGGAGCQLVHQTFDAEFTSFGPYDPGIVHLDGCVTTTTEFEYFFTGTFTLTPYAGPSVAGTVSGPVGGGPVAGFEFSLVPPVGAPIMMTGTWVVEDLVDDPIHVTLRLA
jgi:hypothetical protein